MFIMVLITLLQGLIYVKYMDLWAVMQNHSGSDSEVWLYRCHAALFWINVVGVAGIDILVTIVYEYGSPNHSKKTAKANPHMGPRIRLALVEAMFIASVLAILCFSVFANKWYANNDQLTEAYLNDELLYQKFTNDDIGKPWQIILKYWIYGRKYTEPTTAGTLPFTWHSVWHST